MMLPRFNAPQTRKHCLGKNCMFPRLRTQGTFVAATKCFWKSSGKYFVARTQKLFTQQMFPVRANVETLWKQCFLNNVSSTKFPVSFAGAFKTYVKTGDFILNFLLSCYQEERTNHSVLSFSQNILFYRRFYIEYWAIYLNGQCQGVFAQNFYKLRKYSLNLWNNNLQTLTKW